MCCVYSLSVVVCDVRACVHIFYGVCLIIVVFFFSSVVFVAADGGDAGGFSDYYTGDDDWMSDELWY